MTFALVRHTAREDDPRPFIGVWVDVSAVRSTDELVEAMATAYDSSSRPHTLVVADCTGIPGRLVHTALHGSIAAWLRMNERQREIVMVWIETRGASYDLDSVVDAFVMHAMSIHEFMEYYYRVINEIGDHAWERVRESVLRQPHAHLPDHIEQCVVYGGSGGVMYFDHSKLKIASD